MYRKKIISNILFIGPLPNPIHGMSVCNEKCVEVFEKHFLNTNKINTTTKTFNENPGHFNLKLAFKFSVNYLKLYKIFSADIVYITPGQTFLGVLKFAPFFFYSKLLQKQIIIHIHGNYLLKEYKRLRGLKKTLFKIIIRCAFKGIVLSKKLINNLTPFISEDRIFVLPNFFQKNLISEKKKKSFNTLKICFLSNLMKEKGIEVLLKALKKLERNDIEYKATIAGEIDKKNKQNLLQKIKKLRNTKYVGVVTGNRKKNLLQESNIFILPTFYKTEGLPVSIIEAMATGNVIISTDHAAISDLVQDKLNGFLVKKKSSDEITKVLIYLAKNLNQLKHFSENNIIKAKNNFSENRFETSLLDIILHSNDKLNEE